VEEGTDRAADAHTVVEVMRSETDRHAGGRRRAGEGHEQRHHTWMRDVMRMTEGAGGEMWCVVTGSARWLGMGMKPLETVEQRLAAFLSPE
jgi:hypothetical protein